MGRGAYYPVGDVQWDASGAPYRNTSDGQKDYIPPIAAAQYKDDPRMLAWAKSKGASIDRDAGGNVTNISDQSHSQGNFTGNYTWNSGEGGYEKDNFFDSSLGGLVLGGSAFAAPFIASAALGGGVAGAGSASAAPTAAAAAPVSGGIPAAFGATAVDSVASAAPAAASSLPSWLLPALKVGAPLAINAALRGGGSSDAGANGLTPEQQAMVTRLMQLAAQRQEQSAPVHQAAMLLAQRLGPTGSWGDSPRFQQAVQQTTGPGPSPQSNPQVAAAMQRLMGK